MRIVMITGHAYPTGTALANRIRSYLEALASLDNDVTVLIYKPTEDRANPVNKRRGILNGVKYRNTSYSMAKANSPLLARVTWIYSYINCLVVLRQEHRECPIDVIIQGSSKSSLIPLVALFCKHNKVKYVLENNEYPWFIIKKQTLANRLYKLLYLHVYYRLFDGVLAITRALVRYHSRYSKPSARILHLPMTVDMSRFALEVERENYITYVGNVSYDKDGVGILVAAFINIADKYPDWKLILIGDTGRNAEIRELAKDKQLDQRVILTGSISRDKVPPLLCKSKILALARPSSLQSEGGFPTKLGEYLATGNLVVVTAVGEIPDYLHHKESALIVKPDSIESYASELNYAIDNYDQLEAVRNAGCKVCQGTFNARVQGERLNAFLTDVVEGHNNGTKG
jgi:glycosyltransferase involved in cell wall biosynthesis